MNVKRQLQYYLKARGLTAAELARRSGVNKQSISNWLGGIEPKSFPQMKKIADVLNITIDELIFGDAAAREMRGERAADMRSASGDSHSCGSFIRISSELACVISFDGFLTDVSPGFCSLLGWSRDQLLSESILAFTPIGDRLHIRNRLTRNTDEFTRMAVFESRVLCKSGTFKWLRWSTLCSPSDRLNFAICKDVTREYPPEEDAPILVSLDHVVSHALMFKDDSSQAHFRPEGLDELVNLPVRCHVNRLTSAIGSLISRIASNSDLPKSPKVDIGVDASRKNIWMTVQGSRTAAEKINLSLIQQWLTANHGTLTQKKERDFCSFEIVLPASDHLFKS